MITTRKARPMKLEDLDFDGLVWAVTLTGEVRAWVAGDAACLVETRYGESDLARFAERTGIAYNTLQEYRRVAVAYPEKSIRMDNSWSVCAVLSAQPDRLELVQTKMTAAEARELVAARNAPPKPRQRQAADDTEPESEIGPPTPENQPVQPDSQKIAADNVKIFNREFTKLGDYLRTLISFDWTPEEGIKIAAALRAAADQVEE